MSQMHVLDLGRAGYLETLRIQRSLVAAGRDGERKDFLVLVEHPPVVTLGRTASEGHLKLTREALHRRGVEVHDVERGGDVTYHGPGQLVGYPVIDLKENAVTLHGYLRLLESVLIGVLAAFGVEAARREGLTGVWTLQGKIASIGIAVRRWVTFHGFALNVNTQLSDFDLIVPCGLSGERVTSMAEILGREVDMDSVKAEVTASLSAALGAEVVEARPEEVFAEESKR